MQDTTTQAMTELALGLSMAFFSIMILALLSMQQPIISKAKQISDKDNDKLTIEHLVDVTTTGFVEQSKQAQIIFYFNGTFFQQSLQQIKIEQLDKKNKLVVAVNPNLSFLEVVKLKSRINHPMLSITTINNEWLHELQQTQLEKIQ